MSYNNIINTSREDIEVENVMKFVDRDLMIRICLWGVFIAGLAFMALNEITTIGLLANIGILLMAIDYPIKIKNCSAPDDVINIT